MLKAAEPIMTLSAIEEKLAMIEEMQNTVMMSVMDFAEN